MDGQNVVIVWLWKNMSNPKAGLRKDINVAGTTELLLLTKDIIDMTFVV